MNTTENNKLIAEFIGLDSFKDSLASLHQGKINVDVDVYEQAQYHASWEWLKLVVDEIEQVHEGVPKQLLHLSLFSTRAEVYKAVVEFIEEYNTEQLHEWARINLLPQEDADTRLRFEEGIESYDEDYIKEMYNAKNK